MSISKRTNQTLWKQIISEVKRSNKGGKPGQWSARKAQLSVKKYKKRGGRYLNKKTKKNSLYKWTKQNWRTKSGKPSIIGKNATGERYLPYELIKQTLKKDYNYSSKLKRRSIKKRKQYSQQQSKMKRKLSKYLKKYKA
jgi:hypothetical protein